MGQREVLAEAAELVAKVRGHGDDATDDRVPRDPAVVPIQRRDRVGPPVVRSGCAGSSRMHGFAVTGRRLASSPCSPASQRSPSTASTRAASRSRSTSVPGSPPSPWSASPIRPSARPASASGRRSSTPASSSRSSESPSTSRPRRCARAGPASTWPSPAPSWPPAGRCPWPAWNGLRCSGSWPSAVSCDRAAGLSPQPRARSAPASTGLVVPVERALEAALVEELEVVGVATLAEVAAVLCGGERPAAPDRALLQPVAGPAPDLCDVRGHPEVISALTVAAAGGHNLLLSGPPGVGKTMLARRMPSILPPLSRSEALEVTRIHSVAGLHDGSGLVGRAAVPRAAPHDLGLGSRRRRLGPRAGGGEPGASRGPVPRRAHGVPAFDAGGSASAAGGRPRRDRPRTARRDLPDTLHVAGGHEPVPVRPRAQIRAAAAPRAISRATCAASAGRSWIASICRWPSSVPTPPR